MHKTFQTKQGFQLFTIKSHLKKLHSFTKNSLNKFEKNIGVTKHYKSDPLVTAKSLCNSCICHHFIVAQQISGIAQHAAILRCNLSGHNIMKCIAVESWNSCSKFLQCQSRGNKSNQYSSTHWTFEHQFINIIRPSVSPCSHAERKKPQAGSSLTANKTTIFSPLSLSRVSTRFGQLNSCVTRCFSSLLVFRFILVLQGSKVVIFSCVQSN